LDKFAIKNRDKDLLKKKSGRSFILLPEIIEIRLEKIYNQAVK